MHRIQFIIDESTKKPLRKKRQEINNDINNLCMHWTDDVGNAIKRGQTRDCVFTFVIVQAM